MKAVVGVVMAWGCFALVASMIALTSTI